MGQKTMFVSVNRLKLQECEKLEYILFSVFSRMLYVESGLH